jgi:hypothetical protein
LLGPSGGKRSSAMVYLSIIRLREGFRGRVEVPASLRSEPPHVDKLV